MQPVLNMSCSIAFIILVSFYASFLVLMYTFGDLWDQMTGYNCDSYGGIVL